VISAMNSIFFRSLALSFMMVAAAAAQQKVPEQAYRNFKGPNGTVIAAVLMDKSETEAVLLMRNGKQIKVPLDKLNDEDQAYCKSWSKEKAVFLKKCHGLTIRQCLELRGYESFTFRFEINHILIDGKLNGKPARVMIDTGASTSLLHTPFATQVGLTVGPMDEKIYGVAGEAPAGWTPVPTLQLGEAVFKDRRILATDLLKDNPPGSKTAWDVILGAEFMNKLDAVISYPDQRIFLRPDRSDQDEAGLGKEGGSVDYRLFKTKEGKTLRGKVTSKTPTVATFLLVGGKTVQVPIDLFLPDDMAYLKAWSEEGAQFLANCQGLTINELLTLRNYQMFHFERRGTPPHLFVEGMLNDNKVTYMIDTGAGNSLLSVASAKKYKCDVGPMDEKVWGIGGSQPAAVTKIAKVTMGDAILTNRKVLATKLTRDDEDEDIGYVGLFGADFMRELEAVITYTENRIFLIQR